VFDTYQNWLNDARKLIAYRLIGSIGTIAEDMIIFIQFHTFKKAPVPEQLES